jgi:hypothetical protein
VAESQGLDVQQAERWIAAVDRHLADYCAEERVGPYVSGLRVVTSEDLPPQVIWGEMEDDEEGIEISDLPGRPFVLVGIEGLSAPVFSVFSNRRDMEGYAREAEEDDSLVGDYYVALFGIDTATGRRLRLQRSHRLD